MREGEPSCLGQHGAIATHHTFPKPTGIDEAAVQPERYREIPILKALREKRWGGEK